MKQTALNVVGIVAGLLLLNACGNEHYYDDNGGGIYYPPSSNNYDAPRHELIDNCQSRVKQKIRRRIDNNSKLGERRYL